MPGLVIEVNFPTFGPMDNLQFWLYVIIGLIYFISRMRKKPQGTDVLSDQPELPSEPQPGKTERQPTFEELLREIMEGKSQPEPEPEVEQESEPVYQKPVFKNYDEEAKEEVRSRETLEDVNYDYQRRDSIYSEYEGAKREAFLRPSLEETMSLDETDMSYGKFKAFEIKQNRTVVGDYIADLKDPESLKKAFVMSEILKRKF